MPVLFGAAMLISAPGFAENTIATKDYIADADLVLETAVKEVKAVPADLKNMGLGAVEFAGDEVIGAVKETKAAFVGVNNAHMKTQQAGVAAVEAAWADGEIQFRSYKVGDNIGKMLMAGSAADAAMVDVSAFFGGVEFEGKASAYYNPKAKRLLVRQTMDNLISIENVLADYRGAERGLMGHQVHIQSKFIEVSQKTVDELGFNWSLQKNGGLSLLGGWDIDGATDLLSGGLRSGSQALANTSAAGSALFSKTAGSLTFDLAIAAMEQASDSDVLSSPSVVARDGNTAIIKVGNEQMFPQSFEASNQDTSPVVSYDDWELQLMGVAMEVTPEIREGGMIDLAMHATVKDLVGYDGYELVPQYAYMAANSTQAIISLAGALDMNGVNASMPYFRLRDLETTVTVADGSTVGMGGMIYDKVESFSDEVPLLGSIPFIGRLFRSEGEKSTKRNLMIFVTATQMGVNGQTAAELALEK
jgi:general secretion pathway protein D